MAKIIGIDVSEFQGSIDWAKVKAAGVRFAIIKTGYGVSYVDPYFARNIKGALAQGIPVGAYHFSYALNAAGARNEAAKVIEILAPYKDKITLPVFFDFEYDTVRYGKDNGVTLGREAFNAHAVAFCEAIKAAGYKAGVYYNLDYYNSMVDKSRVGKYVQWYAQYNSTADISGYDIWQYTSTGSISGISGNVDTNILANESLLTGGSSGGQVYDEGWQKDDKGWWYQNADGSYPKSAWKQIGGKWYYFEASGYMAASKWIYGEKSPYYVGSDGAMVTDQALKIDSEGRIATSGAYYTTLGQVSTDYRATLDKLVKKGVLKGRKGTGEKRQIDLSEEAVRLLVLLDRAGVFE